MRSTIQDPHFAARFPTQHVEFRFGSDATLFIHSIILFLTETWQTAPPGHTCTTVTRSLIDNGKSTMTKLKRLLGGK